jgi:hypothetical protein
MQKTLLLHNNLTHLCPSLKQLKLKTILEIPSHLYVFSDYE